MKLTNVLTSGAMSLLFLGISQGCASDPNPIGYLDFNGNKIGDIPVTLNFSVAETRADNDKMANADENKLSKVNIYIFDDKGTFETLLKDEAVSDSKTITIQSKPGIKTIYAISANSSLVENLAESSTLTDFEEKTVNSTLANLKTNDGFVMVGKVEMQEIKNIAPQSPNHPPQTISI